MADDLVLQQIDGGVGRLTLNRPDKHNAFDDALIAQLTAALLSLEADRRVRTVVLAAAGKSFSAGADLVWMRRTAGYGEAENLEDARALAGLMSTLERLAKPTVALVQGAAYGGGVGLVACCDIAIASEAASFSLSEVKLGLIPAVISPYVVAAMGPRAARRFILSAERFSAQQALHHGLVHEVVPADRLEETGRQFVGRLAQGGPRAQAAAKALIVALAGRPVDRALVEETAEWIAGIRAGDEAREGLAAFLEKRPAEWQAK
jgi:methylglutaconyl-CoA hydratase